MADIRPFAGIRYSSAAGTDESDFVAPPYDVLDADGKAKLLAKSPFNIVAVDLPHVPAKQLGPPEAYRTAGETLRNWVEKGVLVRSPRPVTYAYEQSFALGDKHFHRRGIIALVKLTPFGVDVMPHEKTYAGPIEDRLNLMHATGCQLSPVFGLFMDAGNAILNKVFATVSRPASQATMDGVHNKLWEVIDASLEDQLQYDFKDKKVYVADGHHRYTTALHYQRQMEERHGGPLPATHPANYCMFVLVNGEDVGLRALATHRLVGGMASWNVERFLERVRPHFEVTTTPFRNHHVDELAQTLHGYGRHAFGLYDGATRRAFVLTFKDAAWMRTLEPEKSDAWRSLDVAIFQRAIFDEVLTRHFGNGGEPTRGYTADENEVAPKVDSGEYQAGFLLQPTPIRALAELGEAGEVMPPKSTFFFPKLATGMVINPLR